MMLSVFTVYDSGVGAYLPPFYCRSKGEAIRSFTDACNDEKSQFSKYPMDYWLCYLGEYDDGLAMFKCDTPVRIVSATDCRVDEPFVSKNRTEGDKSGRVPM